MNARKQYSLASVAATLLIGFAGQALADECKDMETFALANRPAVEEGLRKHFVSRADVHLRGADSVRVQNFSGCRARVRMDASLVEIAGSNPELGTIKKRQNGSMELFVLFKPADGNKLCISKTDLQKVQWGDMGPVKEKLFVRRNDDKNFFAGCLLG